MLDFVIQLSLKLTAYVEINVVFLLSGFSFSYLWPKIVNYQEKNVLCYLLVRLL